MPLLFLSFRCRISPSDGHERIAIVGDGIRRPHPDHGVERQRIQFADGGGQRERAGRTGARSKRPGKWRQRRHRRRCRGGQQRQQLIGGHLVRHLRRQGDRKALRRRFLRRMQGILPAIGSQEPRLHLPV